MLVAQKKIIGFVVDNDFNNDIRVRKEAELAAKAGHRVKVLCFGYIGKEYSAIENIKIDRIWISKNKKDKLFFLYNTLPIYQRLWTKNVAAFISKHKIEIIHTHDLYMSKSCSNGIKKSKSNCKLILDLHENFPEAINSYTWTKGFLRNQLSAPKKWVKKEAKYLSYPDKIITLSDKYKIELWEQYNFLKVENIHVFPNIIDFRKFEQFPINQDLIKSDKFTILYFGMVAERRGIFDAITAVKTLVPDLNLELLIIGPIDKSDRLKFEQFKSEAFINYIPWINLHELPSYLKIVDVCIAPFHVNPQHDSGVANKIYQYMFGKKPIIASNSKPQMELIKRFNCGLIFKNQQELSQAITSLCNQPHLAKEMGENGYRKLYEEYDSDAFNNNLLEIYNQL